MKKILTITVIASILAVSISPVLATEESQAKLRAQAKISETEAKSIALAQIQNGVVKSAELERERGRLIWSFDVTRPSDQGVTEIQVDANTGKVASTKHETAAAEAKEVKAEQREAKPR